MSYPVLGHLGFKGVCIGMFIYTAKYMQTTVTQRDIKINLLKQLINKKS